MPAAIAALLVEDDVRLAKFTIDYLAGHDVAVTHVKDGEGALDLFSRCRFDIVLLDLGLPKCNGIVVCQTIRTVSDVPIILITARAEEADRVLGLELGADDYVLKPFSPRELLACMRAVVRRDRGELASRPKTLCVGGLMLDEATRVAKLGGQSLDLTTTEFDLLVAFARKPGLVLGREQLLRLVRGTDDETFDRAIDVQIFRLRRKLAQYPQGAALIRTIRGVGYTMSAAST